MAPGEDPPDLGTEAKRVGKHLKDQVSIRRTIASMPQCREAEGVSSVVGEIEATLEGVGWLLRVGQSFEGGPLEPGKMRVGEAPRRVYTDPDAAWTPEDARRKSVRACLEGSWQPTRW